jgi:glucosamine--fructose-6-phosphate aminotransferase (isomerizing)
VIRYKVRWRWRALLPIRCSASRDFAAAWNEHAMKLAAGMESDLQEAAAAVDRQASMLTAPLAELIGELRRHRPNVVVTCARGSSAHAATFAKHLIEVSLGLPVAAAAPNVATVYRRALQLKDQLFLAISQSGRSDDLIETAAMARDAGAITAAVVNDPDSPLAKTSQFVLPLGAGLERSVAATKTFVASLAALLQLTASWADDPAMRSACARLPNRLNDATGLDWHEALTALARAESLITIGRGATLAIAREAALKLKETCELHAEAFSAAEFRHGPIALVSDAFPILAFNPGDQAQASLTTLVADLRRKGACVLVAESGEKQDGRLLALPPDHPDADAICMIQCFYALLVKVAARRGTDADRPRHLQKVTRTR